MLVVRQLLNADNSKTQRTQNPETPERGQLAHLSKAMSFTTTKDGMTMAALPDEINSPPNEVVVSRYD